MFLTSGFARYKAVAWRVLADLLFSAMSIGLALLCRYLPEMWGASGIRDVGYPFLRFYIVATLLLATIVVLVFFGFGVYTRTRFYAHKHKALILVQAVTVCYLLFIVSLSLVFRENVPTFRGVILLAYLWGLFFFCCTRFIKHTATHHYDFVKRSEPARRPIHTVLVVGGAGYIGSVLVRQLLRAGYAVRVLDIVMFGSASLKGLENHERFELIKGDLRHVDSVVKAVRGSDAVIHLGAIVGDPACAISAQNTREVNTIATNLLVHVCAGYGIQRLLFASTCSVYGATHHLMDERSALNPVSLYAESKADAESVVLGAATKDFCPVVLRLATAFGHSYRPRFDLVFNLLVAKAIQEEKITIYNKDQWRPFVHVHDISRAFLCCLEANVEIVRGQIFNVGSYNLNFTLGELAAKIQAHIPDARVEYIDNEDRRDYRVSFDKIHTHLGFRCERTLEDGILEIQQYLTRGNIRAFADEVYDNTKRMKSMSHMLVETQSGGILQLIERRPETAPAGQ